MMAGLGNVEFEGLDAPLSLGHDADFMNWLESMDWEKASGSGSVWSGF
jgi:hypothetical protein